jgi:hypothetical protein
MNRNLFQTSAAGASDNFYIDDIHEQFVFSKDDGSDSGEDFDYGDEEDE